MTQQNYIYVDVEHRDELVKVYDCDGQISPIDFVSSRSLAEWNTFRVTDTPYEDACKHAAAAAKRLGIEWGSNS